MTTFVIYSRKSQEDDDRQIQSIPSQESEMQLIAGRYDLPLIKPSLSESKSAKAPGRPVFNAMMEQVERGQIQGILCWKLDRLARNPVDGGRVIWAIKQNGLIIRTPSQTFSQGSDNLILMYIEFGMAQKYVDDLSKNTIRGLVDKAELGWCPGVARLGYLNSKIEEPGSKTLLKDPLRFDAVRRMWDLMLTGNYSPTKIQKIANAEWGFRTRQMKKKGGRPVAVSTLHKMFSNPFYYGRFEYPQGSGNWYQGQHEPMITKAEFDRVQKILHRSTNPRPQTEFALPFRCLIKCGECGSRITAHFKEQVRCTKCHFKSSVRKRGACFKCGLAVGDMKAPKVRQYAYYHCTRALNPKCRQKGVSATALEIQLTQKLKRYGLPAELRDWGLQFIQTLRGHELEGKKQILAERKKAYEQCVARLENLVRLKTAPENADNSLLSDEEYQKQRGGLITQKNTLAEDISTFDLKLEQKVRLAREALDMAGKIENKSFDGDINKKKEVLRALEPVHNFL